MAVVSLPEETFRSSNATVKASLVFFRRFTTEDATAWEAAWAQANAEIDGTFDDRRNALHAEYAPRILTGEDAELARLLAELAGLGLSYDLPRWQRGDPPAYPRAIGPTQQGRPAWRDQTDKVRRKAATELKRQAQKALSAVRKISDAGLAELKSKYRALDDAHTAALWARVRELFDYPVFVAAPKTVGITSTGETGEGVANELPVLLDAYRAFQAWLEQGAAPENTPNFHLPSAA
jgi:type I restriction enzyme M protein